MALDLSVTQSRILWTVPQSEFERPSRGAEAIARSERENPGLGPFRIARLPEWHPISWIRTRSPDRLRELVAWERDTLQSGHGTTLGLSYTLTPGVLEPEAYVDLFQPWTVEVSPNAARLLGLKPGQLVRYFPRRAYDLWGSRYFIIPVVPDDWLDPNRAIASFLLNTHPLVPEVRPEGASLAWRENEDWQLLKNPAAWPRAWVVHDVLYRTEPIESGTDASRNLKKSLLHQADPFWNLQDRPVENPHLTAWLETDDPKKVGLQGDGLPPSPSESVVVEFERPGHVEIRARLDRDGLIVVADTYAPGWVARIDGVEAPIWRTNRAMRGVVMSKGEHHLVFDYEPQSFRIGLAFSGIGLIGLIGFTIVTRRRRSED